MKDYKDTLNLPKTSFQMRANLPTREPTWLEDMQSIIKTKNLNACEDKHFQLFSGSPYSNGDIHVGHAFNYILKDFIARSKRMNGFNVNFTIGWDNHGLPIELVIEKQLKGKKIPNDVFRKLCRKYAEEQVAIQKKSFYRLGISADFDSPYHTMDYNTEANTIKTLAYIHQQGNLVMGKKPTHYCLDCQSSLAEAEVEHYDKTSKTAYVGFFSELFDADFVAYTTTIWTLPANEALAINPDLYYAVFEYTSNNSKKRVIIEEDSGVDFFKLVNASEIKQFETFTGTELFNKNLLVLHPFLVKQVPVVLADYVSNDVGTGVVHIAPTFGLDDYNVGRQYNLPIDDTINRVGEYIHPLFIDYNIHNVSDFIISELENTNSLYFTEELTHSYPHCWRHKTPTIFMATPQWFVKLDNASKDAVKSLEQVTFYPSNSKNRLTKALENRPDWCISRQRRWGVPIPIFIHKESGELHPDTLEIMFKTAENVSKIGLEAWFNEDHRKVLGVDENVYKAITDTLDVWFDSGAQFYTVCAERGMNIKSDVYLEGTDQHRGWFQSSILIAMAMTPEQCKDDMIPYKNLITHGFVLDKNGKKMSKSLGNVIAPSEIINKYGADVLRLWVANSDYQKDVRIGDEIIERVSDQYKKIRNTLKHLVSNLYDFEYKEYELLEYDVYTLNRITSIRNLCNSYYEQYDFQSVISKVSEFCIDVLSNEYINNTRDRVYTYEADSLARRSAQVVYYYALKMLYQTLEPLIPFTMHELVETTKDSGYSINLDNSLPAIDDSVFDYSSLNHYKVEINKKAEELVKNKTVNSLSECSVVLNSNSKEIQDRIFSHELKTYFGVGNLDNNSFAEDIVVSKLANHYVKCERCWNYYSSQFHDRVMYGHIPLLCIECGMTLLGEKFTLKYM